ncbi:MAG: hypothetical protein U0793_32330 [Gemmataceae bacterium]
MAQQPLPLPQAGEPNPEIPRRIHQLFRDFFDKAEKKRAGRCGETSPGTSATSRSTVHIADVVETFAPSSFTRPIT